MAKLVLELKKKQQRGEDTFVNLKVSEVDGPANTELTFTLHDVNEKDVDVKKWGVRIVTKDHAAIIVNFFKPEEISL